MSNLREVVERAVSKAKIISEIKEVQIHTSYHHEYSSVITDRFKTLSETWSRDGGVIYFRPLVRLEGGKHHDVDEVIEYIKQRENRTFRPS